MESEPPTGREHGASASGAPQPITCQTTSEVAEGTSSEFDHTDELHASGYDDIIASNEFIRGGGI